MLTIQVRTLTSKLDNREYFQLGCVVDCGLSSDERQLELFKMGNGDLTVGHLQGRYIYGYIITWNLVSFPTVCQHST